MTPAELGFIVSIFGTFALSALLLAIGVACLVAAAALVRYWWRS